MKTRTKQVVNIHTEDGSTYQGVVKFAPIRVFHKGEQVVVSEKTGHSYLKGKRVTHISFQEDE